MIANRLPRGPAMCSAGWHRDHGGSDRSTRQSAARPDRCTDPQRPGPTPAAAQPAPSICISALAPATPGPRQNHNPHSAIHPAVSFNPASMRSARHPCGGIGVAPESFPRHGRVLGASGENQGPCETGPPRTTARQGKACSASSLLNRPGFVGDHQLK